MDFRYNDLKVSGCKIGRNILLILLCYSLPYGQNVALSQSECTSVVLLTAQQSRGVTVWGQASLETNHLEILPSVDRQNAYSVKQFSIGCGGLH